MKNKVIFYISALFLLIPKVNGSEEITLPADLQVKILTYTEHPEQHITLNKAIYSRMRNHYLWALPSERLMNLVHESVDADLKVNGYTALYRLLDNSRNSKLLLLRLLHLSATRQTEGDKTKIRALITAHACGNLFFCRDKLIEISHENKKMAGPALEMARDIFKGRLPLVHSDFLPEYIKKNFSQCEVVSALQREDGVYKIWRLSSYPDFNCLTTISKPAGEEYVALNYEETEGRIPNEGLLIIGYDGDLHEWPLKEN